MKTRSLWHNFAGDSGCATNARTTCRCRLESSFSVHERFQSDDTLPENHSFGVATVNRVDQTPAIAVHTRCLGHQLPEDQPSPVGLICSECHARLRRDPPRGSCRGFWESQPALCDGDPCSVFALVWDDFQIRSLHLTTAWEDLEREAQSVLSAAAR